MFRKLTILSLSAMFAIATLAAMTSPSAARHRDRVHFGIGVGVGDGYIHFGTSPRPRYHYPRIRHYHARPYYRHHYRAPAYRHYHQPPVVYHRPRVRYSHAGAHVDWCHARYRSYRAWDNTFQPYHGPRRQCWSPYN